LFRRGIVGELLAIAHRYRAVDAAHQAGLVGSREIKAAE